MFHVEKCEYLEGHKLRLTFNNHAVRDVDLAQELCREVFEPLRERDYFRQVFTQLRDPHHRMAQRRRLCPRVSP